MMEDTSGTMLGSVLLCKSRADMDNVLEIADDQISSAIVKIWRYRGECRNLGSTRISHLASLDQDCSR